MEKHKVEIWHTFNYGGWSLQFKKVFELPCAPYYGLGIFDEKDNQEQLIELNTHEYQKTRIQFHLVENQFVIEVRDLWKFPVRDDVVDEVISEHKLFGWERTDTTNVDELKELMNRKAITH